VSSKGVGDVLDNFLYEAQKILMHYEVPQAMAVNATPKAGVGYACTEAPRGTLWHRYEIDENGLIVSARIEEDIRLEILYSILIIYGWRKEIVSNFLRQLMC